MTKSINSCQYCNLELEPGKYHERGECGWAAVTKLGAHKAIELVINNVAELMQQVSGLSAAISHLNKRVDHLAERQSDSIHDRLIG